MEDKYSADFDFQAKVQSALSGELNELEKQGLELLISNDKQAQEEYIFSEKLSKTLKNQEFLAVSTLIGNIINEEGLPDVDETDDMPNDILPPQYSAPSKVGLSLKTWLIGSVTVLVIALGIYGVYKVNANKHNDSLERITQKYLTPLEDNLFTNAPRQGLIDLEEGMKAYNEKNYAKAVQLLGKHYKYNKDPNVGLYFAISLLMNKDSAIEAEKILMEIMPQFATPIKETAEWYLVIAKLKVGSEAEAIDILENIKKDNLYHKRAQDLLTDLSDQKQPDN